MRARKFVGQWVLAMAAWCCASTAIARDEPKGVAEPEAPQSTVSQQDGNWPELIPTSAFASRSALRRATLSPDGSKLGVQAAIGGRNKIVIFDAGTRELMKSIDVGEPGNMNWFRWAGNDRLLFSIDGFSWKKDRRVRRHSYAYSTHLMVHDLITDDTHRVGFEKQGLEGDDVLYVHPDGSHILLSLSRKRGTDPDIYRFRLDGSAGDETAELVEKKRRGIDEWWADNHGVVRLGMRWRDRSEYAFFYRGSADEDWFEVARVDKDERSEVDNWDVLSIRAGSDMGYALVKNEAGRKVLREFNYRTGTPGQVVYEHPKRDVEGARLDSDGKLVAVTFVDNAPGTHWFDPALAKTQSQLEAALGEGRVLLSTVAGTERMIVRHGAANDPGAMYIYTPSTRQLDLFSEFRPDVDFQQLSDVQIIQYVARDGTPIEGYLTLPRGKPDAASGGKYPLIILPHGGPYGIRDLQTYRDEVQLLANRGYAVLQPNFRGSGGYGDAFEKLGNGQIGRKMQDDLDDAMDWAVSEGHADPDRVCVVGGSYGGFAALWAVIRNPERYRCAASWAGVTDFDEQLKYDRDYFTRRNGRRWRRRIEGDTADLDLDDFSPAKQVERLDRPVLLAHGTWDGVVPFSQFLAFQEAAEEHGKPIETLVLDKVGHSFGSKNSEKQWYDALITFLATHNPSDRPPSVENADDKKSVGIKRVSDI